MEVHTNVSSRSKPVKTKRVLNISYLALFTAGLFYAFFMASKHLSLLANAAPYLEDPYDAVGSFAVLTASALAVINFPRLYLISRQGLPGRLKYVLRSSRIIGLSVLITLAADAAAFIRIPPSLPLTTGQGLLFAGMLILLALAVILLVLIGKASRQTEPVPSSAASEWDPLFRGILAPFNPRLHPWRFCAAFALAAGLAVSLIQIIGEGPAPSLGQTILVFLFLTALGTAGFFIILLITGRYVGVLE